MIQKGCKRLNEKMLSVSGESVEVWKWSRQIHMELLHSAEMLTLTEVMMTSSLKRLLLYASGNSVDRLRMVVSHIPWIRLVLNYIAR